MANAKWNSYAVLSSGWDRRSDRLPYSDESQTSGSKDATQTLESLGKGAAVPRGLYIIDESAHGRSVGDVLRVNSSGALVEANAASAANAENLAGVIVEELDVDSFVLCTWGYIEGLSSLVAGSVYYLQDAGGLGTTAGTVPIPVYIALSTTEAWVGSTFAQGAAGAELSIDDLADVNSSGKSTNDVLEWDGTNWVPLTLAAIPADLDDLSDVDLTTETPATGDLLQYDGSTFDPVEPAKAIRRAVETKTAAYTLDADDEGKVILCDGSSAVVPITTFTGAEDGYEIELVNIDNSNAVTIVAGASTTLNSAGSLTTISADGTVRLRHVGSDDWYATGDLE